MKDAPLSDKEQKVSTDLGNKLLNENYASKEDAKNRVFEKNEAGFNAIMKLVYGTSTGTKTIESASTDQNGKRLIQLVQVYTDDKNIQKITIGKGKDFTDTRFDQSGKRLIQFEQAKIQEMKRKNQKEDFTDNKINDKGAGKKIHEVIDMTNAPDKILRKGSDGTETKGTKKTVDNIVTYVDDANRQIEVKT